MRTTQAHGHQQPTHHLSVCTMNCKSNQLLRWPSATARKNPDMKPVDSQGNRLPKDRGLPQIITRNGQSQDPRLRPQGHLRVSSKPRFPEQNPACRPCSHVCVCAPGSPSRLCVRSRERRHLHQDKQAPARCGMTRECVRVNAYIPSPGWDPQSWDPPGTEEVLRTAAYSRET